MSLPTIAVAAGILQQADGRVLLAQRPAGGHMAGSWEFPGGKIQRGETPLLGLMRELSEELGVTTRLARYFARYRHEYPDRRVELHFWKVLRWEGNPAGLEGQATRWLPVNDLLESGLLSADIPVVDLLLADVPVNTQPVIG